VVWIARKHLAAEWGIDDVRGSPPDPRQRVFLLEAVSRPPPGFTHGFRLSLIGGCFALAAGEDLAFAPTEPGKSIPKLDD
jgi:hypothetical protein